MTIQYFNTLDEASNFALQFAVVNPPFNKRAKRVFIGFNDLLDFLTWRRENSGLEIHEITKSKLAGFQQRLYFDIDCSAEIIKNHGIPFIEIISVIKEAISSHLAHYDLSDYSDYIELNSHRREKYSTHLIYPYVLTDSCHTEHIAKDILKTIAGTFEFEHIPAEFVNIIDMQVYTTRHSLRMHLSPKNGENPFIINRRNEVFDPHTMITAPFAGRETAELKCHCGNNNNTVENNEVVITDDLLKKAKEIFTAGEDIYNATIRNVRGSIINLNQIRGKNCYVCEDKHDNDNPFLFVNNSGVFMRCHGSKRRDRVITKCLAKFNIVKELKPDETISADYLPELSDYINKHSTLFVKSKMGTGKTTQMINYIESNPTICQRAVSITCRRSLRDAQHETFAKQGFAFYNEIKEQKIKISKYPRVVIQWESLHRFVLDVDESELSGSMVVFLDEVNALMRQSLSGLNKKHTHDNVISFEELMKYRTVAFDGLLSAETVDTVLSLKENKENYILYNNCPNKLRSKVHDIPEEDFINSLMSCLDKGENIYLATASGESFCRTIEKMVNDKFPDKKVLTIHGEKPEAEIFDAVKDINNNWINYNLVVSSPVITAGIDFTAEHFDKVFLYAGSMSSGYEDQLQALFRVRNVKQNTYVICTDKCRKISLPTSYDDVFAVEEKRLYCNSAKFIEHNFALVKRGEMKMFRNPEDVLLKFYISAKTASNITHVNTEAGILDYFKSQECEITNELPGVHSVEIKDFNKNKGEVRKEVKKDKYEGISSAREIDRVEYNELQFKKQTMEDKRAIEKFIIRERYDYRGIISPEFAKKYTSPDVIKMWKTAPVRAVKIEQLAREKSDIIDEFKDHQRINFENIIVERDVSDHIISLVNESENKSAEDVRKALFEYIKSASDKYGDIYPLLKGTPSAEKVMIKVNKLLKPFGYKINTAYKKVNGVKTTYYKAVDIITDYFIITRNQEDGTTSDIVPKIYIRRNF